jgi:UDP-N-acetylglucosamine transferase subunit ALG13
VSLLVLALTGTDHHPFQRMVEWVDAAAARRLDVRFVIQHGVSRPPRMAEGHDFLSHARVVALMAEASAVVCHGGPGLITEAREAGHVPLCMPRDPQLGEHVDGHQQRFAALVSSAGVVRTVSSLEDLHHELDSALARATGLVTPERVSAERDAARALAAAALDELMTLRPYRLARLHRAHPVAS